MVVILKILGTIVLAALAGWSYRFGGSSNGIRFVREVGVGIAILGCLTILLGWSIWGVFVMGTVWVETTYFKAKGSDAKWYNWMLVGLSYAIVPLPYMISGHGHWGGFAIRAAVITLFTTMWRTWNGDANSQEIGCGVMQILTLPLLLLY